MNRVPPILSSKENRAQKQVSFFGFLKTKSWGIAKLIMVGILLSLALHLPSYAMPSTVLFQATLTDEKVGLLNGFYNAKVKFYDGAGVIWEENFTNQEFVKGKVELELGKTTSINYGILNKDRIRIGISVNVDKNNPTSYKEVIVNSASTFYSLLAQESLNARSVQWSHIRGIPEISALSGNITAAQVPNEFITSSKILDGTIVASDLSSSTSPTFANLTLTGKIVI